MIGEVLFDRSAIADRVAVLGAEISRDYQGKIPVFIGVLNAAAPFLADLTRAVSIPCEYDVIAVTKFSEAEGIRLIKDTSASIEGRHVILVDDTIDTGKTLRYVAKALRSRAPASFAVVTLLDRPGRRIADIDIKYRGFEIPDVYVVGYGLDYLGRYRELQALHAHGTWP
ncbi:MAG TPA: phosphoribosyltransferase family protein [Candidatus Baltobacteraceae bacterium]|nr:phosphoribosyltransferase family protein [Candidatus Baltobacteraceae bacterium]